VDVFEYQGDCALLSDAVDQREETGGYVVHKRGFLSLSGQTEEKGEPFDRRFSLRRIRESPDELAQPLSRLVLRFAVADSGQLGDDRGHRRESRGVGVRARPAPEDDDAALHAGKQLCGKPGLADACFTENRNEDWPACRDGKAQALAQNRLLAVSADKRDGPSRGARRQRLDRVRGKLHVEALRPDCAACAVRDRVASESVGGVPGQDLARPCRGLQARGDVHDRPGHQELARGPQPGGRLARFDPYPHLERCGQALRPPQASYPLADCHRGPHRTEGIVLVHVRQTEHRHHRVSDEFLRSAAQRLQLFGRRFEESTHQLPSALGIKRLCKASGVDKVGEEDGYHLPLLGSEQGRRDSAAVRAEPGVLREGMTADLAGHDCLNDKGR